MNERLKTQFVKVYYYVMDLENYLKLPGIFEVDS